MSKITYSDKEYIYENASVPEENKITDDNMNEIKRVVNANDTTLANLDTRVDNVENGINEIDTRLTTAETNQGILTNLTTTEKTNLVSAINEVDSHTDGNTTDITNLQTGWNVAEETWTYSSVDDPTGNILISGDVTTKYSLGMRIKFTNGGNTIYGIITKISYSSPNTTLTFLHEINPSTSTALHLMANSAITNNYYSSMKVPYGFPLNPSKWTILYTDNLSRSQATPTANTWYNLGSLGHEFPIGLYTPSFKVIGAIVSSTAKPVSQYITLSTTNNGESDSANTVKAYYYADLENDMTFVSGCLPEINLISKTTYYMNSKTDESGVSAIYYLNHQVPLNLRFICAYL